MKQTLLYSIIIFLSSLSFTSTFAQEDLALGQWKAHLPYTRFFDIAQNDEFLFFATEWSLLVMDKEENTIRFASKVDGLSETGIGVIGTNKETGLLVITYSNSVFDLVTPDRIIGFSDLSRDGNFNDRSINNLTFDGSQFLYFATGFGVVKFDLEREEFVFTVDMGLSVSDVAVLGDNIYAATEDGIFFIDKSDSTNQQAFGEWQTLGTQQGLPASYFTSFLETKGDHLYLDVNDSFMQFDGVTVTELRPAEDNFSVNFITADNQKVILGLRCGNGSCNGKFASYDPSTEELVELNNACIQRPAFAVEDEEGNIWSSDRFTRIRKTNGLGENCDRMEFNAPFSHNVSEIGVANGDVYIASGGLLDNDNNALRAEGVFVLSDNEWSQIDRNSTPILAEQDADVDLYRVLGHPANNKVYIGTYFGGLVELDGEEVKVYNEENSSLQLAQGDPRERVAGMAFDENNNLWLTSNSADRPFCVFTSEGEWFSFESPVTNINQLAIDRVGYKWAIVNGTSQGLVVFDDNGTLEDTSDDRTRVLTTNNSNLPDNQVLSIEADKDGDIWVGTIDGVLVFECGQSAFDSDICSGNRRVVEENVVDDETENLLKGERINAIGVDGGNRKWFGTSNGIFVQDASGTENIEFFDESNSPLLDNNIIDIAFDDESGEVFIGTQKGVVSIRGEAIAGGPTNDSEIYAFPNPVSPDYEGPIAIKGLANNANVKITDLSGALIFEGRSLGGQAIWDGRDYNGRKAATGVYLVFSTADNTFNPSAAATKILFIN